MQTECPHCHTLFRLTEAQFDMADGIVRCGYCDAVFNALRTHEVIDNEKQLDVFEDTPADDHAGQHKADKHGQPVLDQAPTPADTTAPQAEADDTLATLFTQENDEIVPERFRDPAHDGHSTVSTLLWSIAILALIASLIVEYAWFNRQQILDQPQFKPYIAQLCERFGCADYIILRDPDSIEMLRRNVYTHPSADNALKITATMVNHASFTQAYPDVRIEFSDVRGEVVAARRFTPAEYLQARPVDGRMEPGTPVNLDLEILDPGKAAITYEFAFL